MPRCINCKALLPPEFLEVTSDGLAKKCVFCTRGTDTIHYFSNSENKDMIATKTEISKEYEEMLKEFSEKPSIKDIIEAVKDREVNDYVNRGPDKS